MLLRRTLLAAIAFATAFLLAAGLVPARAADPTNTPTPAPTQTPVVVDNGSGATKLVYWNGLTGGDGDVMQSIVANFTKDNPDISVHTEEYDWNTMFQKLQAAFVAGNPPDVFVLHTSEIPQFAKLGILASSDDMLDSGGGSLPAKDYNGIDATMVDGKHYGIMWDNHGFGTWVNLNLFQKAGVDPSTPFPTNGDDLIKLATKLTLDANGKHPGDAGFDPKNIAQYGLGIDWIRVEWESLLFQFGGSVLSSDGKKATINSDAGVKALQWMYDTIYKYNVSPDPNAVNGYNAFQAQKIAIMPSGTWFRNVIVVQHPEIKYEAWPMIQAGPNPGVWMNAHVLFIASTLTDQAKLDAAKKFITYLTNHNADWAAAGHVPARLSAQKSLDPKVYPSNITFGQGFQKYGHFEPNDPNITQLDSIIDAETSAVLNNQKSAKDALDEGAQRMQTVIDSGQ